MLIPHGTIIAVADGEILSLFRNTGTAAAPQLTAMANAEIDTSNTGLGTRHRSSSADPEVVSQVVV